MGDGLKRARDAARATRGIPPEVPKLGEIAERIAAHLARWESDPTINAPVSRGGQSLPPYFRPMACAAGSTVFVKYVSYQSGDNLTKAHALGYLAWLDAGGVGRHWEWERQRADASASKGESK